MQYLNTRTSLCRWQERWRAKQCGIVSRPSLSTVLDCLHTAVIKDWRQLGNEVTKAEPWTGDSLGMRSPRQSHGKRIAFFFSHHNIPAHSSARTHTCTHACMHTQHVRAHTYTHACTHARMRAHAHTHTHTHTRAHARTHTVSHTHVRTQCHTHTHIHTFFPLMR